MTETFEIAAQLDYLMPVRSMQPGVRRSPIGSAGPVPPLCPRAYFACRNRAAERAKGTFSPSVSSPEPTDREPRCALRSAHTHARKAARRCFGRSDRSAPPERHD
jgi:hypothetical protein